MNSFSPLSVSARRNYVVVGMAVWLFSACKPTIVLLTEDELLTNEPASATAPLAATALQWTETSPSNHVTLTARWTPSESLNVRTQYVEFFADDRCAQSIGLAEELLTGLTDSKTIAVEDGSTYSFLITTTDHSGISSVSSCSPAIQVDLTRPSVSIARGAGQPSITNALPLSFDVTFTEPVDPAGFTAGDISQGGTASGPTWQITDTGDHRNFILSLTALSSESGTVQPTLAAGKVFDAAGNGNLIATETDVLVSYDRTLPNVTDLSDNLVSAKTTTWNWNCDKAPCTYRHVVDQVADTVLNDSYGSATSAIQESGTGIYFLHVQAMDAFGNESAVRTVSAVLDNTAPTAPSSLALIAPANSPGTQISPTIRVSGLNVGDSVELHGNPGCTALRAAGISTGESVDLTSSSLLEGDTTFYARSIDPAGNVSDCSTANVVYTLDQTAPTAPAGVTCGTLFNSLTASPAISWSAATDAHGIAKYQVGIGSGAAAPDVAVWSDQGTSLTATVGSLSLTTGSTYYCLVRAVDVAGNTSGIGYSSWSVDAVAPSQPGAITYTPSGNATGWMNSTSISPVFNWGASTDDHSGVARYEIAVGTSAGGSEVLNWVSNGVATSKQLSSLSLNSGTIYYFSVRAIDNAGNASNAQQTSWSVDTVAPSAPGTIDDGTTQANLTQSPAISWAPGSDLLSGLDHYEVAIGTAAGSADIQAWTSVGNVTSATITGLSLASGTTYYASVRAIDGAGNTSTAGQGDGWTAAAECVHGSQLFSYSVSGDQSFAVPAGCTSLTVKLWGGGGGGAYGAHSVSPASAGAGGGAGYATATLTVTPGDLLTLRVGGAGGTSYSAGAGAAGWPNGGAGYSNGTTSYNLGAGGGSSSILLGTTVLIEAGGGGGGADVSVYSSARNGLAGGGTGSCNPSGNQPGAAADVYSGAGGGGWCGGAYVADYSGGRGGTSFVPAGGSETPGSGAYAGNYSDPDVANCLSSTPCGNGAPVFCMFGCSAGTATPGRIRLTW